MVVDFNPSPEVSLPLSPSTSRPCSCPTNSLCGPLDQRFLLGGVSGCSLCPFVVSHCPRVACARSRAIPVGVVAYEDIDENRFKRDVLFCYDLHLANGFQPKNEDGELEDFMLVPIGQVATIIRKTKLFKPNCALVIIDFLFRHGYIKPEEVGYLHLLQSLRRGECL